MVLLCPAVPSDCGATAGRNRQSLALSRAVQQTANLSQIRVWVASADHCLPRLNKPEVTTGELNLLGPLHGVLDVFEPQRTC